MKPWLGNLSHSFLFKKLRKLARDYNLNAENQKLLLRFLLVCLFIAILLFLSAFLVWFFEYKGNDSSTIRSFWDGIWWAIVTIATVGYGDKYPITHPGRVVGMILISVGFVSLSVFTGLIASLFVEDRLKGAKGLKQIRLHNHIVICGWNNTGHFFLKALIEKSMQNTEVCLLMNETPEFYESIESSHPSLSLSFVRGEASQEDALKRANVQAAAQVIILADHYLERSAADDRSIIVANAVHYLVKKDRITVQLINTENKHMLQRIGISKILIWDDIGGYMLANNVLDPNNLNIYTQLVKDADPHFCTCKIADSFLGSTYGEVYDRFFKDKGQILLGLMKTEPELELDSIFDDNASAIDQFIKATLSRSKKLYKEDKSSIRFNPPRETIIQENDQAIVLI